MEGIVEQKVGSCGVLIAGSVEEEEKPAPESAIEHEYEQEAIAEPEKMKTEEEKDDGSNALVLEEVLPGKVGDELVSFSFMGVECKRWMTCDTEENEDKPIAPKKVQESKNEDLPLAIQEMEAAHNEAPPLKVQERTQFFKKTQHADGIPEGTQRRTKRLRAKRSLVQHFRTAYRR